MPDEFGWKEQGGTEMLRTLLFDMYGVILKESKGNFIPYTFNYFPEQEQERLIRQFKDEQLFTKAGNGLISSDDFLSQLGFTDPQRHMKVYLENYLTLDTGFLPFAEKFYRKFRFVLVSNDVSEWSAYITEYHNLNKYFCEKIVSGDIKCRKPDIRVFKCALKQSKSLPQDCIFIDNSVDNLVAAEKLGIIPVLFNRDNVAYEGLTVNNFEELERLIFKGIKLNE